MEIECCCVSLRAGVQEKLPVCEVLVSVRLITCQLGTQTTCVAANVDHLNGDPTNPSATNRQAFSSC
jgi:hypothetical protein